MASHLKHKPELWRLSTRCLCIDHGSKTLGLAVCDAAQILVTPLSTIHRKKWGIDRDKLETVINEYSVEQMIFGYPLNADGTKGARCQSVRDFVTLVEQTWPDIPVFYWDETLSTDGADHILDEDHRMHNKRRKQFKDSLAAKIIMDEALNFINRQV